MGTFQWEVRCSATINRPPQWNGARMKTIFSPKGSQGIFDSFSHDRRTIWLDGYTHDRYLNFPFPSFETHEASSALSISLFFFEDPKLSGSAHSRSAPSLKLFERFKLRDGGKNHEESQKEKWWIVTELFIIFLVRHHGRVQYRSLIMFCGNKASPCYNSLVHGKAPAGSPL